MKKWMEEIYNIADKDCWYMKCTNDNCYMEIGSPQGKEYCLNIKANTKKEFISKLAKWIDNADVSNMTYQLLDNKGHGKTGEPYDMIDIYNDILWFTKQVEKLKNRIELGTVEEQLLYKIADVCVKAVDIIPDNDYMIAQILDQCDELADMINEYICQ